MLTSESLLSMDGFLQVAGLTPRQEGELRAMVVDAPRRLSDWVILFGLLSDDAKRDAHNVINDESLRGPPGDISLAIARAEDVVAASQRAMVDGLANQLQTLEAIGRYTDGLEGVLSTLNGNTDGIEGLLQALGLKDDNTLAKLEAVRALLAGTISVDTELDTVLANILTKLNGTLTVNTGLTGLATDAKLEQVRALLAGTLSVNTGLTGLATQATLASVLSAVQGQATKVEAQPISAAALPLPAGAATQATLASVLTAVQALAKPADAQLVSAAALPLPAGAATEAKLETVRALLAGTLTVNTGLTGLATQATLASVLTAIQGQATKAETQPVSAASLPLPAGAATEVKLEQVRTLLAALPLPTGAATSALQTTGNTSLAGMLTALQGVLSVRDAVTAPGVATSNLAAGSSQGANVNLGGASVARITVEAWTTAADLSFENSTDGTNWYPLYDVYGNLIQYKVAGNRVLTVPVGDLMRVGHIRARSGVPGAYVNQTTATTVTFNTAVF